MQGISRKKINTIFFLLHSFILLGKYTFLKFCLLKKITNYKGSSLFHFKFLSSSTSLKPSGEILCQHSFAHFSHPFSSPPFPPLSFSGSQCLTGKEIEMRKQGNGVSPFFAHFAKVCSPTSASQLS